MAHVSPCKPQLLEAWFILAILASQSVGEDGEIIVYVGRQPYFKWLSTEIVCTDKRIVEITFFSVQTQI